MPKIDFHLLSIGACRHPEFMTIKGGQFCEANFPALVGLIIHSEYGAILFDTGYDAEFFKATQKFPEKLYRLSLPIDFKPDNSIENNLQKYGLKISDIKIIILSHFHGDHIAGLKNFPNAKIYCAKSGLLNMFKGSRFSRTQNGLLNQLLPDDINARAKFFEDFSQTDLSKEFAPFESGIDILGDGSLIAIELKGHCEGHWGLWIKADEKPVFLVGDAAYSIKSIIENIPPPRFTTSLLGKTNIYRETLLKLSNLYNAANERVEIIPSHCDKTAKRLMKNNGA